MKKLALLCGVIALFALTGAACTVKTPENINVEVKTDQPAVVTPAADADQTAEVKGAAVKSKPLSYADYKKWAFAFANGEGNSNLANTEKSQSDCIKLLYPTGKKGDILSNLIADDTARGIYKLNVYTKAYSYNLEQKIVAQTHKLYASDFYAYSVCHLGDNLDILTGELVATGKDINTATATQALVIAAKNTTYIYKNIPAYNHTATGGEIGPAVAKIENGKITWTRFEAIGKESSKWEFNLDGSNPVKVEGCMPVTGGTECAD